MTKLVGVRNKKTALKAVSYGAPGRITPGILPSAASRSYFALLRTIKFVPDKFVELVRALPGATKKRP